MSIQRARFKQNKLSMDRQILLQNINGWYWNFDLNQEWDNNYNILIKFIAENNKLPSTNMSKIYNWIQNQKQLYKKGILSNERVNRINQIPLWKW
jgi:hypothetical protein